MNDEVSGPADRAEPDGRAQPADPPPSESTRVLVVGWPSMLHGEATAGDVLAMRAVATALDEAGISHEIAWSAVMCPPDGLRLEDVVPGRYTHLVFVCGPASGEPLRQLHERFAHCTRIAVGVSVLDPDEAAVRGFHQVLARDRPGSAPRADLATAAPPATDPATAGPFAAGAELPPVLGVFLTAGQLEYGPRRRHGQVTEVLQRWLTGLPAARLDLDTRLDPRDWRLASTAEQVQAVIGRLDAVVTMRMHGLVMALAAGVPAIALDPVAGGGKVTSQARVLDWPALLPADTVTTEALTGWWRWCLSAEGRQSAREYAGRHAPSAHEQLTQLVGLLPRRAPDQRPISRPELRPRRAHVRVPAEAPGPHPRDPPSGRRRL